MVIDSSSITRLAPIALIMGLIVAGLALVTGVIWLAALLFQVLLEGLRLLIDTCNQLSALSSGTPVLHFLFLVGVLCIVVRIVFWAFGTLKAGVRYVR